MVLATPANNPEPCTHVSVPNPRAPRVRACAHQPTLHEQVPVGLGVQKESKRNTSPRAVFGTCTRDGMAKVYLDADLMKTYYGGGGVWGRGEGVRGEGARRGIRGCARVQVPAYGVAAGGSFRSCRVQANHLTTSTSAATTTAGKESPPPGSYNVPGAVGKQVGLCPAGLGLGPLTSASRPQLSRCRVLTARPAHPPFPPYPHLLSHHQLHACPRPLPAPPRWRPPRSLRPASRLAPASGRWTTRSCGEQGGGRSGRCSEAGRALQLHPMCA